MDKYIIRVFDKNMNVIGFHVYTCWYQEEAEANARKSCEWLGGFTWEVRFAGR